MSTLDEKVLDGPNVGYCSSSEDELESEPRASFDNSCNDGPNTGPKGVIRDYRAHRQALEKEKCEKELAVMF